MTGALAPFSYLVIEIFVPGKPFQHSLIIDREAVDYPSEASFRCSTVALSTNIRLSPKGLPKTNTSILQAFVNCGCNFFNRLRSRERLLS